MADKTTLYIDCCDPAEKSAWLASARVSGMPFEQWVRQSLDSATVDTNPAWLRGLSERARIALLGAGYRDVTEIRAAMADPDTDLTKLPNFGRRCLAELEAWIDG